MIKIFCDRCEKDITKLRSQNICPTVTIDNGETEKGEVSDNLELCIKCYMEIKQFIERKNL